MVSYQLQTFYLHQKELLTDLLYVWSVLKKLKITAFCWFSSTCSKSHKRFHLGLSYGSTVYHAWQLIIRPFPILLFVNVYEHVLHPPLGYDHASVISRHLYRVLASQQSNIIFSACVHILHNLIEIAISYFPEYNIDYSCCFSVVCQCIQWNNNM